MYRRYINKFIYLSIYSVPSEDSQQQMNGDSTSTIAVVLLQGTIRFLPCNDMFATETTEQNHPRLDGNPEAVPDDSLSMKGSNVSLQEVGVRMRGTIYAMACVCLSVRLSGTSRCSIETVDQIELVLAWELPSTYHTLCYEKIRYIQK